MLQARIETAAPPVPIPASLWAVVVPAPRWAGHCMVEGLRGVPKPALQAVFGESLGNRIWQQSRLKNAQTPAAPMDGVGDLEIAAGMVAYLSREAAHALVFSGRGASSVTVSVSYADGEVQQFRTCLPKPTHGAEEVARAAMAILHEVPAREAALASIRLAVSG